MAQHTSYVIRWFQTNSNWTQKHENRSKTLEGDLKNLKFWISIFLCAQRTGKNAAKIYRNK